MFGHLSVHVKQNYFACSCKKHRIRHIRMPGALSFPWDQGTFDFDPPSTSHGYENSLS